MDDVIVFQAGTSLAGCEVTTSGGRVLGVTGTGKNIEEAIRKAYAGIFLGKVKKWNDPLITASNPGVKLPDTAINAVVRADSSGTTFVFTQHLSAIDP